MLSLNIFKADFVNLFFWSATKMWDIYYCNTKDKHEHILKFPQKYGMLETKWKIECWVWNVQFGDCQSRSGCLVHAYGNVWSHRHGPHWLSLLQYNMCAIKTYAWSCYDLFINSIKVTNINNPSFDPRCSLPRFCGFLEILPSCP